MGVCLSAFSRSAWSQASVVRLCFERLETLIPELALSFDTVDADFERIHDQITAGDDEIRLLLQRVDLGESHFHAFDRAFFWLHVRISE